jgi:3-methylfumaryl-CoA hydratase
MEQLGPDGHPQTDALVPPLVDRRRMFGGGRITVHEPLCLGEVAVRKSSVESIRIREGRSGWLLLITERHEFSVDGVDRVQEERDIIYRQSVDQSHHVRRTRQAPVSAMKVFELDVDERLLFCFSALTYNAHRIHYDRRYTIDVEGHPDLLVHGPLLAIGAVEAARRTRDGHISSIDYRLVAPSYPNTPITFAMEAEDAQTTVFGVQGGQVKVVARVAWR